jgi:hypothetical protein
MTRMHKLFLTSIATTTLVSSSGWAPTQEAINTLDYEGRAASPHLHEKSTCSSVKLAEIPVDSINPKAHSSMSEAKGGFNVMANHSMLQSKETFGEDSFDFTVLERKNLSTLIAEASLATDAAYNNSADVALKSSPKNIKNQKGYESREKMVQNGEEVVTFSASIKKNPILGNIMAHGELPAGLVSYKEDLDGKARITIAFHGTECHRDALTDLNAFMQSGSTLGLKGRLHEGFNNRYLESREAMLAVIQGVLEAHGKSSEDVDFLITGHSLGGALATLAAVDIKKNLTPKAKVDLITFNSPRVFDELGAAETETILQDRIIRAWRKGDPVSAILVGISGYKHVGRPIELEAKESVVPNPIANHGHAHTVIDALGETSAVFKEDHVGFIGQMKAIDPLVTPVVIPLVKGAVKAVFMDGLGSIKDATFSLINGVTQGASSLAKGKVLKGLGFIGQGVAQSAQDLGNGAVRMVKTLATSAIESTKAFTGGITNIAKKGWSFFSK